MTRTAVTVRAATSADASALAAVGARTFLATYAADDLPGLADHVRASFSPARQAAELADPSMVHLLAEQDGAPVGYAMLSDTVGPRIVRATAPLQLARLYVDEAVQGRGVGAALMSEVRTVAAERGHDVLWLTVWTRNRRARAVYARWGFLDVGSTVFDMAGDRQVDRVLVLPLVRHRPAPAAARGAGRGTPRPVPPR